ncbi:hypothetical protein FGIG_10865 [Fasciola gigantica]|uniref:Calpain catalytic domain-containing protein n=1 Tax=Fasciola gigantica TaxID=46835 RepID=A0A504YKK1_FASGI|nr:hypothetical protein FGIG_10865 [Fasciola gigantica]
MEDLTVAFVNSRTRLQKSVQKDLLEQMIKYAKQCCLMGCSVDSTVIEDKLANGLIAGHAYSVTGVNSVNPVTRNNIWFVVVNLGEEIMNGVVLGVTGQKNGNTSARKRKRQLDLNFNDDGNFGWLMRTL